ncbi:uncharacterized protein LOC115886842 [Sitophilus oryzae]|uniref:Uncharacterized protein LOC115886842 n=1 Tax=Sitophilus oryzae TaxID=7048 RepID=A0A6J2YGJ3_SITOR|nr:uncharacterized protein LOC115886842 [Sitophilus oryzae]
MMIVMGDFNAKVGSDNRNSEDIMGKHGLGNRNNNGESLLGMCSNYQLTIGGTLFPHNVVHKATWKSPDGHTTNQIDHFLISRKWRNSLFDLRAYRGADHYLLIAEIKLKIAKIRKTQPLRQEKWEEVKESLQKIAEENLGYQRHIKKPWISDGTWEKIKERKKIKQKILQAGHSTQIRTLEEQYLTKNKEVKRSARRDKRLWTEELAEKAQMAAEINDSRTLYRTTKTLAIKNINRKCSIVKDKEGNILASKEDQLHRWTEFFSKPQQIIATVIQKRISDALEPTLRKEQADFRPQRSCIDQINTLRIIIEQSQEFRSPLYMVLVDFQRAFDTIKHIAIWKALREKGVPEKISA